MAHDTYYPPGPFRRFVWLAGGLEVAEREAHRPGAADEIFDEQLLARLLDRSGRVDAVVEHLLEAEVAKGFIWRRGNEMRARFVYASVDDARRSATEALEVWAREAGLSVTFE